MLGASTLVDTIAASADSQILQILKEKRKEKSLPFNLICQLLMASVKETVLRSSTIELALICEQGEGFDTETSEDVTTGSAGNNIWSTIPLRSYDTGKVMLQKIATATLLVRLVRMVNDGVPEFTESWVLCDVIDNSKVDALELKDKNISKILGW